MTKTVSVKADERVLFVGKTRSGKTYLAEHMTQDIARLICLDPKPSLKKWSNLETVTSTNSAAVRALLRGENRRIRVPDPGKGMAGWLPWYDLIWRLGDVTGYFDEINLLVHPRRAVPIEFSRLYQQGAERGIGVWSSTQRPVNIPLICVTEAEWIFMFRLGNKDDRKLIAGYGDDTGKMIEPIRDVHGFWTYNQGWMKAVYTTQLNTKEVTPKPQSASLALPTSRKAS
jgi:hypothetical protein